MCPQDQEQTSNRVIPNLAELVDRGVMALDTEVDDLSRGYCVVMDQERQTIQGDEILFIGEVDKFESGWYKHYKGGIYYAFGVCVDNQNRRYILYHHQTDENEGGLWARPYESFASYVQPDPSVEYATKRFIYQGPT